MVIRKGERVGICGETGDGKSTLLKLLNRFYLPDSGHISIDHVNMDQITMSSYRKLVGSVQQENIVFPGSIRDNILFAVPNATEYELIEACKKAELYNFVSKLPEKFDTVVGPRGLTLSGGQKQRIALARLFLQDPEIILLDEATSALDNETETLIQDAIAKLEGKTIITVAHRLSTIKDCDCIYVMKGGRVAEFGTHEKLIERGGIYAAMNK
jgi:ABC-type multidrug transport system fused ATPase/permease subunit